MKLPCPDMNRPRRPLLLALGMVTTVLGLLTAPPVAQAGLLDFYYKNNWKYAVDAWVDQDGRRDESPAMVEALRSCEAELAIKRAETLMALSFRDEARSLPSLYFSNDEDREDFEDRTPPKRQSQAETEFRRLQRALLSETAACVSQAMGRAFELRNWNRKLKHVMGSVRHPRPVLEGERWTGYIERHLRAVSSFSGDPVVQRQALSTYLASWQGLEPPPAMDDKLFAHVRRQLQAGAAAPVSNQASAPSHALGAAAKDLTVRQDCEACPPMVQIPAGDFVRGASPKQPGWAEQEGLPVPVSMKSFWVSKTEVTQELWTAIVGSNPSSEAAKACGLDCPVNNVSWTEAQAFVRKLGERTGNSYRLLTEDEWEYAARAGATTAFHTGERLGGSQANFHSGAPASTQVKPVASYPPNAWGLHDVHGNVAEWTQDCFVDRHAEDPTEGAVAVPCQRRVVRGGSFVSDAGKARLSGRVYSDEAMSTIGLRVALDAD